MEKRSPAPARIVAVVALVGAAIALGVVVSGSTDSDSASKAQHGASRKGKEKHRSKASTYVVETGDTLISIAHETGVPVPEIIALNPEIDPQILIAGETLKLK